MSLTLDIIKQLPKAELHCHLDGFCRPSTIVELAKEQGVKLPTENLEELKKILTAPPDCPDLVTYLRCFDAPLDVMQYAYAITRIFYEACEDAVNDGIMYLELRFAPALHTRKGLTYSQILQAAIDGVHMAQARLPIVVRIICCAMRHMSPELNQEVADIAWRFRDSGVVGFDLAGPENGFPPHKFIQAFRTVREKNLAVTIHAGEAYGAVSVKKALLCGANRIGHGTRSIENQKILQLVIDKRIPVEMCVSSNVQTKAIQKIEDHPIKDLFQKGVICVPCTDNPTVSGVTLSGEYLLLHQKFGFNVEQIVRLMDYGFRSAFIDKNLQKRLRIEAITRSLKVLKANGIDVSGIAANSHYYNSLGLNVPNQFAIPKPQPQLTMEIIQKLKKADVDTRLSGSVPLKTLYSFYQQLPENKRVRSFASEEEFSKFFVCTSKDSCIKEALKVSVSLLQNEANIRQGVKGIIAEAIADNVVSLEIRLYPEEHTQEGLTEEQVISIVCDEAKNAASINARVVLAVGDVDPLYAMKIAQLAVEFEEKGVVGFSFTREIIPEEYRYFQPIFDYLRKNFINVSMFAGERDPQSVPVAIIRGNARRVDGAYRALENPNLLKELAARSVPVVITNSHATSDAFEPIFATRPIRDFMDFGVYVAYSSANHSFSGKTRSQELLELAQKSGFGALELVRVIHNTFSGVFLHYEQLREHQNQFWADTIKLLKEYGFDQFWNPSYFIE